MSEGCLVSRPRLMIVGPGELYDADLAVAGEQLVAHYGDAWQADHTAFLAALRTFLDAPEDPYPIPGSGSVALEAAFRNLFEPAETVVVVDTGFFGVRLLEVATAVGLDVHRLPVAVGEPVDPSAIADAVVASGATGVAVCHVDTSTATRHPIEQIAASARAHGAITLVDGIASVGGEDCRVEAMQLGCLVTSTQKGIESAPGLGIVAVGREGRARIAARTTKVGSYYLDLGVWDWYRREWPHHPHPVTMSSSLLRTTRASLERILTRGLGTEIARKHALAAKVRDGLEALGLPPVARADAQSGMIVAAYTSDAPAIVSRVLEQGIQIGGGLAPLAGRAIRIGIMGATATDAMVDEVLAAVGKALHG